MSSAPFVVRSPNWLGDAIMALPAVRNVKTWLGPERELVVATPPQIAAIWRACPFVDRVLELTAPKKIFATAGQLRAEKFEGALLLPNSLRAALEARLAGIRTIVGYRRCDKAFLLTKAVRPVEWSPQREHQQYFYIDLATLGLGAPDDATFPQLALPAADAPPLSTNTEPLLALCPGAEYGPAKRWPIENYASIANHFHETLCARVTVLGGPKDVPVAAELETLAPYVENLVGKTSLGEFMHHLQRARLVVCNDSGSMHLAAALNVPTVAVYGSTEPKRTGPLGTSARFVRHHVPCSPCYLRECPLDGDLHLACFQAVPAAKLLPVCLEMWASGQ